MSTSAGPSLEGIGRGGDSNLVLEMDAHDAKSYPGEPTTNTIINGYFPGTDTTTLPTGWSLNYSASKIGFRPAGEDFFYKNLGLSNPRVYKCNGGGWYSDSGTGFIGIIMPDPTPGFSTSTATTVSFWYRFTGENAAQLSNQYIWFDFDYGLANLVAINYTDYNDTEWHFYSATQTSSGSYLRYNLYIYAAPYAGCPGGSYFEIGAVQIEQKGYATPFVGEGQFARPASTNLMIHGDVGTGASFYDSSPSKHTITAVGDVAHSATKSKFSGGSIYFDSDLLTIPTSSDWDFGTADFTVDLWTNVDSGSIQDDTFFSTLPGGGSPVGLCLSLRQTEPFSLGIYTSIGYLGNGSVGNYTARAIYTNIWYHIALVRADGVFYFYVDGTNVGTVSGYTSLNLDTDQPFYMGRFYTNSGGYYLNGFMDEIRVTKGTALWTAAFTPPTRRNLSAPVVDRSGNDNGGNFATTDPTDVATYRVGEVIRPIANAYWNFDGTDDSISLGGTTVAASDRPLNAYPFTFTAWVTSDNGWVSPSGMNELLNMNIAGQRVSLGSTVYSGWPTGPAIMYGGTSHWTCPSSAFGNPTGWTHIAFVIYGSNNSNHKIYINGVSQALTDNGLAHGGTAGWTLGSNSVSAEHWVGNIANAQLYDKTLTEAEIVENFNQQNSRFNPRNWANRDIVKDGLQLWLDAQESASYSPGTGSTWYDLTGNNYDVTLYNDPLWNSGGYFDFNGTDQWGRHTFATSIGTQTYFTCEVWVKWDGKTGWNTIFDMPNDDYLVGLNSGVFYFYDPTHSSGFTLTSGTWYQLVVAYDSTGTSYFYVNGASVSSFTNTITKAPGSFSVGAGNGGELFDGQIAIINWYNRQLSASEIEQNFIVRRQRFGI